EAFASISDKDKLFGNLTYTYSNMSDIDKQAPNMPALTAAADYKRQWTEEFGTQIGLIYIGERFADLDNSTSMDGFVNLSVSANYQIINDIKVYIDFDNLTNSGIFMWNGYKEKGLFMSLGVLWQF
ncbi:MAG: TonB-dependent receptor, partial [Chlorobi bacterium]|nr:TonB-dependent receptor [Chlorobiota bacterium]